MPITNFWGGSPSLASTNPGWETPSNPTATEPAKLDPNVFAAWTRQAQIDYVNFYGSGTPRSVELGVGPNSVTVSISNQQTLAYQLPASLGGDVFTPTNLGRPATASELATVPSNIAPSVFLSWTREDQLAYVQQHQSGGAVDISGSGGSGPSRLFATLVPQVEMGTGVIRHTSGDYEPIPYHHLSGSASGSPSSVVVTSAEALFPTLDGEDHTLAIESRPPGFYEPPGDHANIQEFLDGFSKWHEAYRLEYVKRHAVDLNPGSGTLLGIDVQVPAAPTQRLTAIVSIEDDSKLIIVQSLDKAAFAKLSQEDQLRVSNTDAFGEIAGLLGVTPVASPSVPSVTQENDNVSAEEAANQLIEYINTKETDNSAEQVDSFFRPLDWTPPPDEIRDDGTVVRYVEGHTSGPMRYWRIVETRLMPTKDREAFTVQLEILKQQLGSMGVVAPSEINRKLTELKSRFDRAFAFYDVKEPTEIREDLSDPDATVSAYRDVISTDNNSAIDRGYQIFIAQEKRMAEVMTERMQVASSNSVYGQKLDVPYLVFFFQSRYNLQLEHLVVAETEEINQQNELLKIYAAIQDAINKTLSTFEAADDGKRYIFGRDEDDYRSMSTSERMLLGMFEDNLGSRQKHPMEILRGIERPLYDFFEQDYGDDDHYDLNEFTHTQWSTYGTRLSEHVTIINQNSQIKMNDVNSLDKQRNRHFELANNALSKMNDMIQSIARAA